MSFVKHWPFGGNVVVTRLASCVGHSVFYIPLVATLMGQRRIYGSISYGTFRNNTISTEIVYHIYCIV